MSNATPQKDLQPTNPGVVLANF